MPTTLFILNDPPYGTERSYNALRLAGSLSKREGEEVKVFLIGDAASCAKKDQKVPQGYHNVELMLRGAYRLGAVGGSHVGVPDRPVLRRRRKRWRDRLRQRPCARGSTPGSQ